MARPSSLDAPMPRGFSLLEAMTIGMPMVSASAVKCWGRTHCSTKYPSPAANVSTIALISSSIVPWMPIDHRLATMSVMATTASSMAMSTCCPCPVRSRWRRAASTPMVPNSAELMSPRAPTGLARGPRPGSRLYS